ncbi:putative quinol monooxygenase [Pantoea sp. B65]|uniref:putative quinol monooxygenase n=1 Tax=Pantoea sp. B65 TaxID=2813359 RepID=UPI0039B3DA8C
MLTITAVIKVKDGYTEVMSNALKEVTLHVEEHEPATIGFFVSQDLANPCVFTTYERFVDQDAMDTHNNSPVVARFFDIAKPILDGEVLLVKAREVTIK